MKNIKDIGVSKTVKANLMFAGVTILILTLIFSLPQVFFPFIIALVLAYITNPVIEKINSLVKNRGLSVFLFCMLIVILVLLFLVFVSYSLRADFIRLKNAYNTLINTKFKDIENAGINIFDDATRDSIRDWFQSKIQGHSFEDITEKISPYMKKEVDKVSFNLGPIYLLSGSVIYYLYIISDFDRLSKIFSKNADKKNKTRFRLTVETFLDDVFESVLLFYIKRLLVVFILMVLYATGLKIIGIPGAIVLGILVGLIGFFPNIQWIAIFPLSLGCLVLSIEKGNSFFLYFGMLVLLFFIVSLIEEHILKPKIMKTPGKINPAFMILSVSVFSYFFGPVGAFVAVPLTALFKSYFDRGLFKEPALTPVSAEPGSLPPESSM